jgi:hypothetical protein
MRHLERLYNDWLSFQRLLDDIDKSLAGFCSHLMIVAVNDGSALASPDRLDRSFQTVDTVEILDLAVNLGHQRAIVVGLAYASRFETDLRRRG